MGKKYIVCDSARSNWGKTELLTEVIRILSSKYKPIDYHTEGRDSYVYYKLDNGKTVFVSTLGDPGSGYLNWWQKGIDLEADIFVYACRTGGYTLNNLINLANTHHYEIIWFKNFHFEDHSYVLTPTYAMVQDLEATHICDMIHLL